MSFFGSSSHFNYGVRDATAIAKYPLTTDLTDTVNSYTGTMTRSTAKTYITSSGTVASVAANVAAFNGGLIIEPATTNLTLASRSVNNASYWNKQRASFTTGQSDPEGTSTAVKVTSTALGGTYVFNLTPYHTITAGQRRYYSCFVSAPGVNYSKYPEISLTDTTGNIHYIYHMFDLNTGTVGTYIQRGNFTKHDAGIVALANDWFFIWIAVNTSAVTSIRHNIGWWDTSTRGTGLTIGNAGIVWQSDHKATLTSPITTTTASVANSADILTLPTTGWKTSDFSIYFEYKPRTNVTTTETLFRHRTITGVSFTLCDIVCTSNGTNVVVSVIFAGITHSTVTAPVSLVRDTTYKILIGYPGANGYSRLYVCVNGTKYFGDPIKCAFVNHSSINLGSDGTISANGTFTNFKFITTTNVTPAEAEAL